MCRKLTSLVCFALMLGILLPTVALGADPNLIGWWKLDEGSGDTAFDSSRSGNDGTIQRADSGGLGPGGSVWVSDPDHGVVAGFNGNDTTGSVITTGLTIPAMTLTNDFTWAFWGKQHADQATNNDTILGNRYGGTATPLQFIKFTPTRFEFYNDDTTYSEGINYDPVPSNEWTHHVVVKDGTSLTYYRNGVESGTNTITKTIDPNPFYMGGDAQPAELWQGYLSDVRLYTRALTYAEVLGVMKGLGEPWPYASSPSPTDGALHKDTWVNLSWKPGARAVSHDVYLGESRGDVNDATHESSTFRGNQTLTYYVAGFPGFAYPDGLVPGMTYYWRIDEVNEAEPNSPWKGDVWSFSIPPKTAYNPDPADSAESVAVDAKLSWTPGFGARLHTVYFGDDFDTVANAAGGPPEAGTTYDPGPLKGEKLYYWRVDEFDGVATYKGDVWSFTTPGAVGNPQPANGAADIGMNATLRWTPADSAASYQLYFGTDKAAVRAAGTGAPEDKGSVALAAESYDPGPLEANITYYWRVDEVEGQGATSKGPLWSFTTGQFLLVDDFESYTDDDAAGEAIWQTWIDGFGVADNGAQVGYLLPPYAEQTIVHGGSQSMPLSYANEAGVTNSEAVTTLTAPRDWTQAGVSTLVVWFVGSLTNAAEPMYVAIANSSGAPAVVAHDNPGAAQINNWTRWAIPLQTFADQGINLSNVDKLMIGLGTKGNAAAAGGSGKMYFDDIRLYQSKTP
jgi:Concanavalin A-like lectin/glucanases superfamily